MFVDTTERPEALEAATKTATAMGAQCQNDFCDYVDRCSIRLADEVAKKHKISNGATPAPPAPPRESWRDPVQSTLRRSQHGWVRIIYLTGKLEDRILAPLRELAGSFRNVSGLMIVLESSGGSGVASRLAHGFVVLAKTRMPVVCYVRDCRSATMIALAAADAAFCHHRGVVGCFGLLLPVCDGANPHTLVSSRSPQKYQGGPLPWFKRVYATEADHPRLQARIDREYAREFNLVVRYTGTPAEMLAPYLDGRCLTPAEAKKAGLINAICDEDAAYAALLDKIERKRSVK